MSAGCHFQINDLQKLAARPRRAGKSLVLNVLTGRPGCPDEPRAATLHLRFVHARPDNEKNGGCDHLRGVQVSSFSYLPLTFTTLFLLAASLLLGLIR